MYSTYKNTNWLIIWTMILVFWLVILFLDGRFSVHDSSDQESLVSSSVTTESSLEESTHTVASIGEVNEMVNQSLHQELGSSEVFQDLHVLEYLYIKNKNPELLQPLVEKFLQYYQFDKANQYLTLLVAEEGDYFELDLDPHQVIYTRFHDSNVGLDSVNSLSEAFTLVKEYRTRNMITADDEMFYKGLQSLRAYDYTTATAAFGKVTDPRYKDFVASYEAALANYVKIKNPPVYYRDALVSLTLLKNWYFSFAKRLALRALNQDETYILPYQVLAYTNFLMHNREAAKEYFLKLADFDAANEFLYKFLIGVCYYRYGDYEQSILYLNQVTDPGLKIDVYRYMLLGYIQAGDGDNILRMRQNLLGEVDLQPSDFALFFDQMFYIPFRTAQPFTLYLEAPQLVDLYLGKCSTLFTGSQADICTYGQVGLQLAKQNLSWISKQLLSLAETYHQSHLYHLLGDYYFANKQYSLAKDTYLKALSICDNSTEQSILQNKITQATDAQ